MIPGEIARTPYDLQFRVAGIPVRVHPVFWLSAALLAFVGRDLPLTLLQVGAVFAAVLVHELGHAGLTRRFGGTPRIVLFFFGGYATTQRFTPRRNIAVLTAGPAAGFLLGLAAYALVGSLAYGSKLRTATEFLVLISVLWNGMNLLPVLPLDGGQICRELLRVRRGHYRGEEAARRVSFVAGAAVAVLAGVALLRGESFFGLDPLFVGVMFAWLAALNRRPSH